ncbi:Protein pelota-like protein [Smittium culicis]|uniref:Protein pelota-like protein n=1 Tax=Smittium culicis TaxID=133412 RepID=A0A1R1WZ93_9FUNG|nr:Protein pelota-like protein [Smittium culicis]
MKLLKKYLEKDRSGRIRLQAEDAEDMWHLGQFHTLDLERNQPFAIIKEYWDSISLERISNCCDVTKQADVAAIVMQEGLANICLLTQYMTIVRQRIDVPIPKKRKGSTTSFDKSVKSFYDKVYNGILAHVDFSIVKAVIVGSPGFTKDQFMDYLWLTATRTDEKRLLENRKKFVSIHTSSGHKSSLEEVMRDPTIKAKLSDTKASNEVLALDSFYQMMNKDPNRAFYGYKHVSRAVEAGAVGTLLITDELFRNQDISKRKQYIRLVENVKKSRANVIIFSSLHVSGEQLNQLTGVAAILNFPLPEIESDFESD